MADLVIIYDTEFTTWEGALENAWSLPGMRRELVQYAAIVYDPETGESGESLNLLVRPVINPELSDYFINLTGISNEDVAARGLDFPDAFEKMLAFGGGRDHWSYGSDSSIIHEACRTCGHPDWQRRFNDYNIAPFFSDHGVNTKKVNSGRLAKTLGVDIEIREHNALDDVRSIIAACNELRRRGAVLPFA